MPSFAIGRSLRTLFITGLLFTAFAPHATAADVCITIDESRDTFSPQERSAALMLLTRQFELAGERVVPPGCAAPYVVSHVQLGNTITIILSGPNGHRDATAIGLDDVPAVYSQMVRSLVSGKPMNAAGVVDRTNVSNTQAMPANRVYSDSLFYARLGYGGVFADRTYGGPSVGIFGYRREFDRFGIDVSFFNMQYQPSTNTSYYSSTGHTSGTTANWLTLKILHFTSPLSGRSIYVGGGLTVSQTTLDRDFTRWSGSGLGGELTAGYELGRTSTIRAFLQLDGGLPFYHVTGETYNYTTAARPTVTTSQRYAPSLTMSFGIGWQRGGR